MKKKFGLLFGLAFLVRLISLNQSLWLDEAVTAKVVRQFSLLQIPSIFSPGDFHPPLYYIFMKMWSMLFGTGEIALRMPSVIFSLLTGHAVYLIASRIRSRRFGLWAAALYLFNPLAIYYAQEARMYSLATFLLSFMLYFSLELLSRHDGKKEHLLARFFRRLFREDQTMYRLSEPALLVLSNLFMVLAMWTFYGSIFFIAAVLLLYVIRKKYQYAFIGTGVLLVSLALQYPLISAQLANAHISLGQVANWSSVLGTASLKNLALIPVKFSVGRISFYPKAAYYILAGIWTLFSFSFLILGAVKQRLLSVVFFLPLLLGFAVSFSMPMMQYFRFLFLVPVMSVLIAEGIEQYLVLKKKEGFFHAVRKLVSREPKKLIHAIRENALYEVVLGGFLFLSLSYLLLPRFHREDWRSLTRALPAGKTVYMILPSSDPLLYYRQVPLRELRTIATEPFFEQDTYVIPYAAPIYGFDYETVLHGKGCYMKERRIFREVYFERWSCGFVSVAPRSLTME